jgi:hypothetical protein
MWDVESGVFNKEWMKISLYLHFTKMDQKLFSRLFAPTLAVLRRMPAGERGEPAESGPSKREWAEFLAAIGRD